MEIELDHDTYQALTRRASIENKSIEEVIHDIIERRIDAFLGIGRDERILKPAAKVKTLH